MKAIVLLPPLRKPSSFNLTDMRNLFPSCSSGHHPLEESSAPANEGRTGTTVSFPENPNPEGRCDLGAGGFDINPMQYWYEITRKLTVG